MVAPHPGQLPGGDYTHLWRTMGTFTDNPMASHWTGIVMGLGFAISFGYWTTDFLVVQRVLTARDLRSAKLAPIIGAAFRCACPSSSSCRAAGPGRAADDARGRSEAVATGAHSYNEVLPLMLARYCARACWGSASRALIAGFMSGMAGNVSAFATVWTYDIYRRSPRPRATPLRQDRTLVHAAGASWSRSHGLPGDGVQEHHGLRPGALQLLHRAPPGTVLLGMLWRRATPMGGFLGLLSGVLSSIGMWAWVKLDPAALRIIALSPDAKTWPRTCTRPLELARVRDRHGRRESRHHVPERRRAGGAGLRRRRLDLQGPEQARVDRRRRVPRHAGPSPAHAGVRGTPIGYGRTWLLVAGISFLVTLAGLDVGSEGHVPLHKRSVFWAMVVGGAFVALNVVFW